MRLRLLGLVLSLSVSAALFAGCGNSVDPVGNPTPTPTEETPTPTPGGFTGTYSVSAAVPIQQCLGNDVNGDMTDDGVQLNFTGNNVYIGVDGSDITPDWNFSTNVNFSVPDPEHGTISGSDWTVNYTYCDYDPIVSLWTTKHVTTWIGHFNGDGTFSSNLTQKLRNAPGNHVSDCGATEASGSVTMNMNDCTTNGLTWSISGVMN